MTNKQRCENIFRILGLCYDSDILETDQEIDKLIRAMYKALEENGSINILSKVMDLKELNNIIKTGFY